MDRGSSSTSSGNHTQQQNTTSKQQLSDSFIMFGTNNIKARQTILMAQPIESYLKVSNE